MRKNNAIRINIITDWIYCNILYIIILKIFILYQIKLPEKINNHYSLTKILFAILILILKFINFISKINEDLFLAILYNLFLI
jgi:hypothetical protein